MDVISGRYVPGTVYWFRGTKDFSTFARREELLPAAAANDLSLAMATANTVDWDGDADLDLLIGNVKGEVFLSRNEGTKTEPRFESRDRVLADGAPMKVVLKSDPWPVDWDADGRLDLLVGDEAGDVSFFRGRGGGTFDQGLSLFTGERVDPERTSSEARRRLDDRGRVIPGYRLRLATADWNADGKLDLLIGNCEPAASKTDGQAAHGEVTGHVRVLLRR